MASHLRGVAVLELELVFGCEIFSEAANWRDMSA